MREYDGESEVSSIVKINFLTKITLRDNNFLHLAFLWSKLNTEVNFDF